MLVPAVSPTLEEPIFVMNEGKAKEQSQKKWKKEEEIMITYVEDGTSNLPFVLQDKHGKSLEETSSLKKEESESITISPLKIDSTAITSSLNLINLEMN